MDPVSHAKWHDWVELILISHLLQLGTKILVLYGGHQSGAQMYSQLRDKREMGAYQRWLPPLMSQQRPSQDGNLKIYMYLIKSFDYIHSLYPVSSRGPQQIWQNRQEIPDDLLTSVA